jgi:hypothetical protein
MQGVQPGARAPVFRPDQGKAGAGSSTTLSYLGNGYRYLPHIRHPTPANMLTLLQRAALPILGLMAGSAAFGQSYVGYTGGNYAGYANVTFNPALCAQTPYAFDLQVLGLNAGYDNDFLELRNDGLFGSAALRGPYEDFDDFRDRALIVNYDPSQNGERVNFRLQVDVQGPGALIPLSPHSALTVGGRFRTLVGVDRLGVEAARLALDAFEFPPLWGQDFETDGVRFSAMNWIEYAVGYSHGIDLDADGRHYLAGGVTLKLLQGTQGLYLYSDDLNYNFTNDDLLTLTASNLSYGHSEGSIDLEDWDLTEVSFDRIVDFNDTLGGRFPDGAQTAPASFRMGLPRTLTASIDAHVVEGLYVGLNGWWSPLNIDRAEKVRQVSRLSLNPRWEMRWFGAGVPVSWQDISGLDAGLYLRLGPLILGSANLWTNAFGEGISGADAYLLLRVPLLHGRRVETTAASEYNAY